MAPRIVREVAFAPILDSVRHSPQTPREKLPRTKSWAANNQNLVEYAIIFTSHVAMPRSAVKTSEHLSNGLCLDRNDKYG